VAADQFVVANGARLHWREWGGHARAALLIVHGFSTHARTWDQVAEALGDRFRVLALDLRGHGESQWTAEYSLEALDADVIAFARAANLGRFALVGHALGGGIALRLAAAHPALVERLVVIEALPPVSTDGRAAPPVMETPPDVLRDPGEALSFFRERVPRVPLEDLRGWVERYRRPTVDGRWTWGHDPAFRDGTRPGRGPARDAASGSAELRAVACPTLLVRGGESMLCSRNAQDRLAAAIRGARTVELAGAGHLAHLEDPAGLTAALRAFLVP